MTDDLIFPRAVLFDMDGTLTEPLLDFPRIKVEMGIGSRPILEALAEMTESQRKIAEAILIGHEDRAAAVSTLNPGCKEVLELLESRGVSTALITRNSRCSVNIVLVRHGLSIPVLVTRDDAPFKPSPQPLHLACRQLGVLEADAWMVGDGQYDVEAGCAAGVRSVWVSHGRAKSFSAEPWGVVRDLLELRGMLSTYMAVRD